MKISKTQLRKIIAEELGQQSSRTRQNRMPRLASILFEDMSQEDAVEAIEAGIVEPLAGAGSKKTVEDVVSFLNSAQGKDATVRKLLAMGANDGNTGDEVLSVAVTPIEPATNARPTQSQIGLPNSIGYAFTTKGKAALDEALSGNVNAPGILAAGDGGAGSTFIVDGHHRWSSNIVVNPDVKISVNMISADDPFKALAISQVVIAGWAGPGKDLPSATSEPSTNMLAMDAESIKSYLKDSVGQVLDSKAGAFLTDDVLDYLASKAYGGASAEDDRDTKIEKICTQIALNCKKVPAAGDAPPRSIMPQFAPDVGGPDLSSVKGTFTGGAANFRSPIVPESRARRTNDLIILERWQKLAGLIKG